MNKGRSVYLDKLKHAHLFLDSPLPLEITGSGENYVASWLETGIEGEGSTEELAIDDCRNEIINEYLKLQAAVANLSEKQELTWAAMSHYIGDARKRSNAKPHLGEEYMADDKDKGPVFG